MSGFYQPLDGDVWDIENSFYLRSEATRVAKMIAQYEIYKLIVDLPGAIVECGVFKGASFNRLAAFRRTLENEDSRELIGFDAFGSFPTDGVTSPADRRFISEFETNAGRGIACDLLEQLLRNKGHCNFTLVPGDVTKTVGGFVVDHPEIRVALLHLDLDVYEPTRVCLDVLVSRVVPGGIVMFDDYNVVEGATRAADEFCAGHGLHITKLPFYNVPAYAVVEERIGSGVGAVGPRSNR